MIKPRTFFIVLALLSLSYGCHAELKLYEIELAVEKYLQSVSSCTVDAKIENVVRVAESDFDYSNMWDVLPDDLEVLASAHLCGNEESYYLWMRQVGDEFEVVAYTSLSQPE